MTQVMQDDPNWHQTLQEIARALSRQATATEALLRLTRQFHGLTPEETPEVPWTPETPPSEPALDPDDPASWSTLMTDSLSYRLEQEAEQDQAKAASRPR